MRLIQPGRHQYDMPGHFVPSRAPYRPSFAVMLKKHVDSHYGEFRESCAACRELKEKADKEAL